MFIKLQSNENETKKDKVNTLDPNMSCLDFPSPCDKEERQKDLNRFVWYLLTYECVCNEKLLALKFVKSDQFFSIIIY